MTGKMRAAVCAAVVTGCFGAATALGDAPAGAPGCVGQQEAFFAQVGKTYDGGVPNGIGGLAHSTDVSAAAFHAAALANCAATP